jgi:hypothetical protein
MDHVHVWVYRNTGADESSIPNSLYTTDFRYGGWTWFQVSLGWQCAGIAG